MSLLEQEIRMTLQGKHTQLRHGNDSERLLTFRQHRLRDRLQYSV